MLKMGIRVNEEATWAIGEVHEKKSQSGQRDAKKSIERKGRGRNARGEGPHGVGSSDKTSAGLQSFNYKGNDSKRHEGRR
jgi:hypothetical protein